MLNVKRFICKLYEKKRLFFFFTYSLVFALTASIVFSWFYRNRVTFVSGGDGVENCLNFLIYYGRYLRQIIYHLMETGKLSIPLFDFSIGFGSDILTSLHFDTIGDPLNLLAAIVPASKAETLVGFLFILRLYLAGIAFLLYSMHINKSFFNTLCGALIYTFCGYVLYVGARHTFMTNAMIYLPLILLGVELVFKGRKPYLFISMVFLSAVSSFYYFYMLSILMVIYAAIRFFTLYRGDIVRNLCRNLGVFSIYYIIGLLMACAVFLPITMFVLSSNRAGAQHIFDAQYPISYYKAFLSTFITPLSPGGHYTYLGYSVFTLISLFLLFTKRKNVQYKIGFLLLTLFLLIPAAGYVFNGFSYVTNRWIFGYSFVVALITTAMMPDLLKPDRKQLLAATALSIAFFINGLLLGQVTTYIGAYALLNLLIVLMYIAYIFNVEQVEHKLIKKSGTHKKQINWKKYALVYVPRIIALLLIVFGISLQANYYYSPNKGNSVAAFKKSGVALNSLANNPAAAVKNLGDTSFYRIDAYRSGTADFFPQNFSLFNRQNSVYSYLSMTNPNTSDYYVKALYAYCYNDFYLQGLDGRVIPGSLASVKYYAVKNGYEEYLPYGYDEIVYDGNGYSVYENKFSMPFGYTYDGIIQETAYDNLAPIEKQQAMLQGAVARGDGLNASANITPEFNHTVIPYRLECGEGIEYSDGAFTVNNTTSTVVLSFSGLPDCETYLGLYNMHYDGSSASSASIMVDSANIAKGMTVRTPKDIYYSNQHDILINMCDTAEAKTEIIMRFSHAGVYKVDEIEVICQPVTDMERQFAKLKESTFENVNFGTNLITGTIDCDKDKIICFSIPYSTGWTAYVDGEKTEVFNINTMYSGIYVQAGNHEITLKYVTPYLIPGCILSILGFCLFAAVIIYCERKKGD